MNDSYAGVRRKAGILILAAVFCISMALVPLLSCTPREVFGELIICRDIDPQTLEPVDIGDEYSIDSPQIAAAVKVSGVRGDDRWRFTWKDSLTGEVIADSANNYSLENAAFVEGYLSNLLLPAEGSHIIAEPGEYTVSYYHNSELKAEAFFTIEEPPVKIMEAGMARDIDEENQPAGLSRVFYQDDEIYAFVRLDYKLSGESYGIRWYKDEMLLGEEEYTIEDDSYLPGYIIFQLINQDQSSFPVGDYRLEIISDGSIREKYDFEVLPLEFDEGIFSGNQVYSDQDFGFQVSYPDGWDLEREEIEAGLKAGFAPDDTIRQVIVNMWVLKQDYYPPPEDYSGFADQLVEDLKQHLEELKETDAEGDITKTESGDTAGDTEIFEVRYDNIDGQGTGWSMTFSFLKKQDLLFLFMRLTDTAYIDYGEKVVDYMIGSINFEE